MRRTRTGRIPMALWLVLVWVLLWGSFTPLVLLSALVVAPLCLAACRLPVLPAPRPRWRRVPRTLGRFGWEVVVSSLQVVWATVRRGPRTRSAVVAVPVSCSSDVALTVAANRLSLVPGTLVVDLDRDAGLLYVYVLDVRRVGDLEEAREVAERGTEDVLRTLGEGRAGGSRGAEGEKGEGKEGER